MSTATMNKKAAGEGRRRGRSITAARFDAQASPAHSVSLTFSPVCFLTFQCQDGVVTDWLAIFCKESYPVSTNRQWGNSHDISLWSFYMKLRKPDLLAAIVAKEVT